MILYYPKYFTVQEFVYPKIYSVFGARSIEFMDPDILIVADAIREFFARPVYINDWQFSGQNTMRGLRPFTASVGSKFSMHKYGRAIDFVVQGIPAEHVRAEIIEQLRKKVEPFTLIQRMEVFTSWTHIDTKRSLDRKFTFFDPSGRVWDFEEFTSKYKTA